VAGGGGRAVTAAGQRLDDRYEVVRSIGAGGMTRVFEAWDRHERRRVAVKMPIRRFADDRAFVARLEREVDAVAGLAHPNVAEVHEVRWDGRAEYVVAELVDGSSLSEMLAARGTLVAVGLPRGGPHRPAASRTPAPPSSAVRAPTTSDPATSSTPSQAPTTAPATTAGKAEAPPSSPTPGSQPTGGAPERRTVPSVLGLHSRRATEVLHRARLRVRVVDVGTRSPRQAQRVVDQDPTAGEVVPGGSVVTVVVAARGH
jgi:hypothetical protein